MAADGSVIFSIDLEDKDAQKQLNKLKNKILSLEEELNIKSAKEPVLSKEVSQIAANADLAAKRLGELKAERARLESLTPYDGAEFLSAETKIKNIDAEIKEAENETTKWSKAFDGATSRLEKLRENLRDIKIAIDAEKEAYGEVEVKAQEAARAAQEQRDAEQAAIQAKKDAEAAMKEFETAHQQLELENLRASAEKADGEVAALNQELAELKARQKELESAGIGLGYQEYDDVLLRINEINGQLREYKSNLLSANGEEEELAENAEGAAKEVAKMPPEARKMSAAMEAAQKRMEQFQNRIVRLAKNVFAFTLISKALRSLKDYLWQNIQTSAEAQAAIAKLRGALLTMAQPLVNVIIPAFTKLVELLAKVAATAAQITSKLFGTTVEQSAAQAEKAQQARDALKGESKALKDNTKAAKEAEKQFAGFDEIQQLTSDHAEDMSDALDLGAEETEGTAPNFKSVIGDQLDAIAELFVGLALITLGAILTFSGANIPLGIGLMIVGALTVWDAVSENWGAISQALQGTLGVILGIVSGALLVLGAILAFSGANIPLGIGLMVAGAVGLATVIAANWGAISNVLRGPIGIIVGILSAAALVLGAILAFSGANIPLGIGLMVIGAAGMAGTIAANWNTISNALRGPIGVIVGIISAALLVIGAILVFTGANLPLGIGMLVVGAVGLAATVAANWNAIPGLLKGPIGVIVSILSGALLVIGAIMTFTGANIPLGIGMMVAGAAGLAASVAANWNALSEVLQGPIGIIMGILSGAALVIGAILAFSGVNIPLGIGLMVVGAVGMAGTIAANWNAISDALGGPIGAITAIVGAALLALGVILLFTGAGIPLGLGLILAGAAGLAATAAINWDWLPEKLSGIWKTIREGVVTAWNSIIEFLGQAWNIIRQGAAAAWDGIWGVVRGAINLILGGVEAFINGIIVVINTVLGAISAIASVFSSLLGFGNVNLRISPVHVPRLAAGAVIPPNREFLAVLGDQSSGNNIEAPEALLRQMAQEAASANTELLREILQAIRAGQTIEVDRQPFGRVVRDAYDRESARAGMSFVQVT